MIVYLLYERIDNYDNSFDVLEEIYSTRMGAVNRKKALDIVNNFGKVERNLWIDEVERNFWIDEIEVKE